MIAFSLYFAFVLLKRHFGMDVLMFLEDMIEKLKEVKQENEVGFYVFIVVFSVLNTVFILPFYTLSYLVFAYLINHFWTTTFVLALIPIVLSIFMHFFVNKCCAKRIRKRLQKFEVYNVLIHNTDANSVVLCLIIRFLYIPLGSKEYIIAMLEYGIWSTLISAGVYFFLHSLIFAFVAQNLESIGEILKKKSWSQMSTTERMEFSLVIGVVSMTVVIFCALNFWVNKKIR